MPPAPLHAPLNTNLAQGHHKMLAALFLTTNKLGFAESITRARRL